MAQTGAQETTSLDIVDSSGKKVGTREISAGVFGNRAPRSVLHEVVRWQRAKKRAGTHSVLTRDEVSGGGTKPWRQKGTGRARAGSNTSPLWVRGGAAHGPKPRSYEFRLNKQERQAALATALETRRQEGRLFVLKSFSIDAAKTKKAGQVLSALGIAPRSHVLVVLPADFEAAIKSLRNIDGVRVLQPQGLNVYDVLRAEYVVLLEEALPVIEARF